MVVDKVLLGAVGGGIIKHMNERGTRVVAEAVASVPVHELLTAVVATATDKSVSWPQGDELPATAGRAGPELAGGQR